MSSFSELGNDLYTGRRSFPFIAKRRQWYTVAGVLTLISVLALVFKGLTPGIEFSGGTEFRISGTSITSEAVGAQAVTSIAPTAQPRVSRLGSDSMRVQAERISDSQLTEVKAALAKAYQVSPDAISSSFVGPSWGADVTRQALIGLLVFLALVTLVITLYFRTWAMAVAALVALLHDLLLTAGVYALVGFEVTPASVIGFLTILGYSLYDTVVVFDKVRENTENVLTSNRRTFAEAANLAVNQTLVRSINTSVVALLPVASILFIGSFLLGAGTLKDIALALFVGIAAGTYSSIFVATPLYVDLRSRDAEVQAQAEKVRRRRAAEGSNESAKDLSDGEDLDGSDANDALATTVTVAAPGASKIAPASSAGSASTRPRGGQRAQPRRKGR